MSTYSHIFKDKPIFGLDIDHDGSLRVAQFERHADKPRLIGYGSTSFNPAAMRDGIIVDYPAIASAAYDMFNYQLVGKITTKRAAIGIPTNTTFSRILRLPQQNSKLLSEVIASELKQTVRVPLANMYYDYRILKQTIPRSTSKKPMLDIFITAVTREVIDSQRQLVRLLGLDMVSIETTAQAASKLFLQDQHSDIPAVLVDIGSQSTDISIFDKEIVAIHTIVGSGSEAFTSSIRRKLNATHAEAQIIKTRYGLGPSKKQAAIRIALEPVLQQIVREIQRMIRSYDNVYGSNRKISQVIILGNGADMPGVSEYVTNTLRLAARSFEPWTYCDYSALDPPSTVDKPTFGIAMGLGLMPLRTLFKRKRIDL
jgi:type IV pilus assembly protein PilM